MMRRILASAGAVVLSASPSLAQEDAPGAPIIVAFRTAHGASVQALAWRDGARILADPRTLRALGVAVEGEAPVALESIAGLSYAFDAGAQAIDVRCVAPCASLQRLALSAADRLPVRVDTGAFASADLGFDAVAGDVRAYGAFDVGAFTPGGYGGLGWTVGADGGEEVVRLETFWTHDDADARVRTVFGDALAPGAGPGAPFRFGGVLFGTDFSLDPTFTPFPTPIFSGEAAAPSVVDLYIDGALRARRTVAAGPFEIADAPVSAGAGIARVVAVDALGRERVVEAPFYASPSLLRPGLSDYSLALGAERRNFARASADYGRRFALASYRRGLSSWATISLRGEWRNDAQTLGGGASFASQSLGQIDLYAAGADGPQGAGGYGAMTWLRRGERVTLGAAIESADEDFRRLGVNAPLAERSARATIAFDLARFGRLSATSARVVERDAAPIETLELAYGRALGDLGAIAVTALMLEDGEASEQIAFSFVRALAPGASGGAQAERRRGGWTYAVQAHAAPPSSGGFGWRAAAARGADARTDLGVAATGRAFEAHLDFSETPFGDGLRGAFASGVVALGDGVYAARRVRDSFALVDVGAADVDVHLDGRFVGRTDLRGRLLLSDLRAYEPNRIGVDVSDLPLQAEIDADEILVRPAARSGVVVRFPVRMAAAGAVRVARGDGAPLPEGAILERSGDGARFPVGRDGRVYLSGTQTDAHFTWRGRDACRVTLDRAALESGAPLICASLDLRGRL
ncbi:MAG: fimbria/pilus outer membrane usher protein [Hyphomonadaceae bacterium]|nr:fimbria/pilus outer membrane usher protein [Hyphomonadaceae bacterium]